jgi:uncharacterized membrane protein
MESYRWLIPATAYIVVVGVLGVTAKLALRHVRWPDIVVWTCVVYVVAAIVMVVSGSGSLPGGVGGLFALATGTCAVSGLICTSLALRHTRANIAVPYMSAYPVVTVALSALVLGERLTLVQSGRILLVLLGLVLLSV